MTGEGAGPCSPGSEGRAEGCEPRRSSLQVPWSLPPGNSAHLTLSLFKRESLLIRIKHGLPTGHS